MSIDEYAKLSDEELIRVYRDGDSKAADYLIDRNRDLVRMKTASMRIFGIEESELIQEGMIGLFRATQDYDCGRDASFRTFASLCVERRMYSYIRDHGRKKNMPLNTAISIYQTIGGDGNNEDGGDNSRKLEDILSSSNVTNPGSGTQELNPEDKVLSDERMSELSSDIEESLSDFELDVLNLMITGMGYIEIAHVLNRDGKSVDNAIQRLRGKIRKIVKKRG